MADNHEVRSAIEGLRWTVEGATRTLHDIAAKAGKGKGRKPDAVVAIEAALPRIAGALDDAELQILRACADD